MIPFVIIGGITGYIYSAIVGIFGLINFFTVLFAGKRYENFYSYLAKFLEWGAKAQLYFFGATDERPPLTPF